jgi:hypothetical protein
VDLVGKGGRVRTVAIPVWVKHAINAWQTAAKIEDGRLLRPLSKSGRIPGVGFPLFVEIRSRGALLFLYLYKFRYQ